jgi:uncharacterized protein YfaS (alpha-2-macroglobulin family)
VRERGAYRPGERVHLVGWAALDTPHTAHNLATPARGSLVEFTLQDPLKKIVARTTGRTTPAGKFTATLKIPADATLGHYTAIAALPGGDAEAHLKVQDYRIPEFTVTAAAQASDILGDEPAVVDLDAAYLFGAPVALTDVTYDPDCRPIRYTPPNLEHGWTVGLESLPYSRAADHSRLTLAARPNDPPGRRTLRSVIPVIAPQAPHRCTLTFFAQDASAQGVGAEAVVTLHPAPLYLAIHPPALAYRGDRLQVPLRALTRDGERVAASSVQLHITRNWDEPIYKEEDGLRWQSGSTPRTAPLPTCTLDLTADGPDATCKLTLSKADPTDSIELVAVTTIDGRVATTSTNFRVRDRPNNQPTPPRWDPPKGLELHPSKTTVRPGDRVEVVVRAPWSGARGQLVTARRGVHDVHPFVLEDQQATIILTADDSWTPTIDLVAHVIAAERPNGLPRRHTAAAKIAQDPSHRRLTVAVDAPRQAGPGDSLPITVTVRDPAGRPSPAASPCGPSTRPCSRSPTNSSPTSSPPSSPPASARSTTSTSSRPSSTPTSRPARTPTRCPGTTSWAARPEPPAWSRARPAPAPSAPAARAASSRPPRCSSATRSSTPPAPPASPRPLPDNLTTFRVTALASADLADAAVPGRFGGAEARVVVTAPLVVRAAAPRQLRPGDTAELAALIDNRTGEPGRVVVTADLLDGTGPEGHALEFLSDKTARVELPAHGQARVAFQVRARAPVDAKLELRARFTPRGPAAPLTDAIRVALPVVAEPTLIDRAADPRRADHRPRRADPIKAPAGAQPGHGGLELRTATSLVAGLDDAARALVDYPYGCAEQTASRLLPAHRPARRPPARPPEFAATTLARLASMQTHSGGFAYWPGDPAVHPYASAYITWLLQRGSSVGLPVPEGHAAARPRRPRAPRRRRRPRRRPPSVRADLGVPLALALHALADAGRDIDAPAAALFARAPASRCSPARPSCWPSTAAPRAAAVADPRRRAARQPVRRTRRRPRRRAPAARHGRLLPLRHPHRRDRPARPPSNRPRPPVLAKLARGLQPAAPPARGATPRRTPTRSSPSPSGPASASPPPPTCTPASGSPPATSSTSRCAAATPRPPSRPRWSTSSP